MTDLPTAVAELRATHPGMGVVALHHPSTPPPEGMSVELNDLGVTVAPDDGVEPGAVELEAHGAA